MLQRSLLALAVCLAAPTAFAETRAQTGAQSDRTGYASVNGLEMYYEIHGEGPPLVLLHGALMTIENFGELLPSLAKTRQVIVVEQQAHGRTADIDRPFSYQHMADDTAALLQHLGIENADIFGYSMGGGIALELAIRYPDLVDKLVVAAAAYSNDGVYPEVLEGIENLKPEDLAGSPWQEAYASVAPHREDWPTLLAKVQQMDMEFEGWSPEAIRSIEAPTLLVVGMPTSCARSTPSRCSGCSAAGWRAISRACHVPSSRCCPAPPTSRSSTAPTGSPR